MHQSLPGTRLTGLWCNNFLSFNLIFLFSFPLRLFVCSHDFGCCLSSGGMYTCSSQTLVHLSALRCFWWSAMLLFSSSFFYTFTKGVFVCRFFSFDFLSLHRLIWTSDVCLFSLSLSWWFVFYLCGWLLGSCRVHLPTHGLGSGSWCFVTTLLSSLTLFSLWWSLSLIFVFLKAALSLFSIQWAHQRTFAWLSELIINSFTHWLIVFCSLVAWKGNTAPSQCGSALLILWIWRVTVWLRPGVVLNRTGPNCGRKAQAEECVERDSGMVQMIHACSIVYKSAHA